MGYRRRIYYTQAQKTEIWDRWQRGDAWGNGGSDRSLSRWLDFAGFSVVFECHAPHC